METKPIILKLTDIMPFGKYKGVLVSDMDKYTDLIKYSLWFKDNIETYKFCNKFLKRLSELEERLKRGKELDKLYYKSWMAKPCSYLGNGPDWVDFDLGLCGQT